MSLGALTATANPSTAARGPIFYDDIQIVGDNAYPTNGSTGLLAKLRTLRGDSRAIIDIKSYSAGGYHVSYDVASDKLKISVGATGVDTEVANATDLSGTTFKFVVISQ